ncbi:cation efflux family-domain-containing protein [Vararia minispora EC-137]|uniref:Cation efflux family-domain-containing protein n=1 Tax=Vararia minispora EC-137 TaxID=1314806 RepID=A0ACB8QVT3_9AGAM|nr:cation efflux family-domain-containing protein [Vararia minispora EC-137]
MLPPPPPPPPAAAGEHQAAPPAHAHTHPPRHADGAAGHDPDHAHDHDHEHGHEHGHGIFGHSHGHGEDEGHGTELIDAFSAGLSSCFAGDKGARITLIGLFANVLLTSAKGAAGWFMNSAALLAEAGHSLSDLLGDLVVLFSWRLSRRPPSARYPFGLAKFETFGTTAVALLLLSGGLGIGIHSLSLLIHALSETAATVPPGSLQTALQNVTEAAHSLPALAHAAHAHAAGATPALDPNAAWFAALSVVAKEWLFRITRRVAAEESSPVLMANAFHHRSDAYSSAVALVAILGSTFFPALPLDPIGGVLVSLVIMRQGLSISVGAFKELTDASAAPTTLRTLERALDPLLARAPGPLVAVDALRARRAGSTLFVDLTARVVPGTDVAALQRVEDALAAALRDARKDVKDVSVRFREVEERPRTPPGSGAPSR